MAFFFAGRVSVMRPIPAPVERVTSSDTLGTPVNKQLSRGVLSGRMAKPFSTAKGVRMSLECRCPHLPYSHAAFMEAQQLLGRRQFLLGAAAAGAALLTPWRARAAAGVTVIK